MPNEADREFRERVRDAIQAGGKSGKMSQKTGIPIDTLNKYVSLRSVPSAVNALKIAAALGITVEQLARGELTANPPAPVQGRAPLHSSASIDNPTLHLRRRVRREVKEIYDQSGLFVHEDEDVVAAMDIMVTLTQQVRDLSDEKEVEWALGQLLHNLRRDLAQAVAEPGASKRSASGWSSGE